MTAVEPGRSRSANLALWIVQALLTALFLFAGVMKFAMSVEQMNAVIRRRAAGRA